MMRELGESRTYLFVPGHRSDRFDKAAASGADAVIIDLEDAVGPKEKAGARESAAEWLRAGGRAVVRVNGIDTQWFERDIEAVGNLAVAVMVPKAEFAAELGEVVRSMRGQTPLIPLIETVAGVFNAREICACDGVVRVAFGNVDLAASLGVDPGSRAALAAARSALVYASAAAECAPPIDGVTTAIADQSGLLRDAEHAKEMGFSAKLCIHPSQLATVERGLSPTDDETAWANAIVQNAGESVGAHDGMMIDPPVLARARQILELSATGQRRRGVDG